MKVGVRKPSIKNSVSARTKGNVTRSINRSIKPMYGKKGMGYINNPKKAVYNKVYKKSTVGSVADDILVGCWVFIGLIFIIGIYLAVKLFGIFF